MEISHRMARLAALFRPPAAPVSARARGVVDRSIPKIRRIVVGIDAGTFERLAREAERAELTLSETIRRTLRDGHSAAVRRQ